MSISPQEISRPAPSVSARKRSTAALIAFGLAATLVVALLLALGTWQVERRAWKLDLIERVDQRIHAPATAAPGPADWPALNRTADEYRRVRVSGAFLHDRETLVQAVTELGGGFWVVTPLRLADGSVVLVNRGFVPPEQRDRATRGADDPAGETTVTGLLRFSEPGTGFLRKNDPAAGRWYARDVPAIAEARGLSRVAPYFIDADAAAPATAAPGASAPEGARRVWPVGGLTVVTFNNNHLGYAITWYTLALMAAAGAFFVGREEYRRRRGK